MPSPDFTLAQADDLAKYFLGKDWFGVQLRGQVMLSSNGHGVGIGNSWREAFRSVHVNLPLRPQYVAKSCSVMMGEKAVCTAVSETMAKRIAAALNNHIPDRRGI
jgi:hypothetical protein